MKVNFQPFDAQHYLMNLRINMAGALQSDRAGDQYSLILRLPFQQDCSVITPEIFANLLQSNADELMARGNQFIKVGKDADIGLFIRTAVVTGFQVLGGQNKASAYAMFCCEVLPDPQSGQSVLTVYYNPKGLFINNVCNVPAVVQIHVQRETIKKFRGEKFTGFQIVDFSGSTEVESGSMWYVIPGCGLRFPITSEVLRQQRIYIKSDNPPIFESTGGVRVVMI